jgi:thioredoxin reductase
MNYDAIIVGGGPAGLSAALVLGRCGRRVLVCDSGRYRNQCSHAMHGYLTRDGLPPGELLRIAREELVPYGVEYRKTVVTEARKQDSGFHVVLDSGEELVARKLLLATGVMDRLPEITGLAEFYGKSIHHCPYCDGWEWRDQPVAVYGAGKHGYELALSLLTWTCDIVLVTGGPAGLDDGQMRDLEAFEIPVREEPIARLEGRDGRLEQIVFESGEVLLRRALFFSTGQEQHCELAETLGCAFNEKGTVDTAEKERTNVPGLFVAGDASRDVQFVIVAAAEGAKAAVAINEELQEENRRAMLDAATKTRTTALRISGESAVRP